MPSKLSERLEKLAVRIQRKRLYVGIPGGQLQPQIGKSKPPPLHVIGYIMEFGDETHNIPPRPFLVPGVKAVKKEMVEQMAIAAQKALQGGIDDEANFLSKLDDGLQNAGLVAQASVKQTMLDGPYTPLKPATVAARARRRDEDGKLVNIVSTRSARKYGKLRKEGVPLDVLQQDSDLARPLIDTEALFRSISFAVKG